MKQKHLYSLLDNSYVTIVVSFKFNTKGHQWAERESRVQVRPNEEIVSERKGLYTYKAPKSANVQVGDTVVVDSPSYGICVVPVVEVHVTPQIDLDAPFEYKWIVQKVDRTDYDARVEKEHKFGQMMLEVERTRQREALLESMRATLPADSEARKLFDSATQLIEVKPEAPLGGAPGSQA